MRGKKISTKQAEYRYSVQFSSQAHEPDTGWVIMLDQLSMFKCLLPLVFTRQNRTTSTLLGSVAVLLPAVFAEPMCFVQAGMQVRHSVRRKAAEWDGHAGQLLAVFFCNPLILQPAMGERRKHG